MARQVAPKWILPVNLPAGQELRTLSATENGVRKYIFKEGLPQPAIKVLTETDVEYWIWNTETEIWHETPGRMPKTYMANLFILIPLIKAKFGKLSLFGEDEGTHSVLYHSSRDYRDTNRIYVSNPALLSTDETALAKLLRSDEELEEEQWDIMEERFNSYIEGAKQDLERNKETALARLRDIDEQRQAVLQTYELLLRTSFDDSRVTLKAEMEKIKQMKEVRKIYVSDEKITIEVQPVVTAFDGHQYFMGEYRIKFLDGLPDIENMSFSLGNGNFHPHISASRVCFGSFDKVFNELMAKRDYVNIVRYCLSFIQKYNKSSAFNQIEAFPVWDATTNIIKAPSTIKWFKKYPQWGIV